MTFGSTPQQHVIGAKLQNHEIGAFAQREIRAREPGRRRLAGDSGVDDRGVESIRAQPPLQLRGKSGVRRQHVARRETVAKGEDAQRFGAGGDEGAEQ